MGNDSMTSFDDEAIVEDEDEEVKGAFQRSVTAARGRVSGEGHHFGYSGFANFFMPGSCKRSLPQRILLFPIVFKVYVVRQFSRRSIILG